MTMFAITSLLPCVDAKVKPNNSKEHVINELRTLFAEVNAGTHDAKSADQQGGQPGDQPGNQPGAGMLSFPSELFNG